MTDDLYRLPLNWTQQDSSTKPVVSTFNLTDHYEIYSVYFIKHIQTLHYKYYNAYFYDKKERLNLCSKYDTLEEAKYCVEYHYAQSLLPYIEHVETINEWQPIETAPKTTSYIMLSIEQTDIGAPFSSMIIGRWNSEFNFWEGECWVEDYGGVGTSDVREILYPILGWRLLPKLLNQPKGF